MLEWNGYKVIYAGDTAPNKWFMEHAKGADIMIYECMLTPEQLMEFYGQPAQRAMMMQTDIHTSAQAFGKIMSTLRPRHAVAYHFSTRRRRATQSTTPFARPTTARCRWPTT